MENKNNIYIVKPNEEVYEAELNYLRERIIELYNNSAAYSEIKQIYEAMDYILEAAVAKKVLKKSK